MVTATEAPTNVNIVERALIDLQQLRRHRAGTVLFREGDAPTGVYIIHSGTVELLATSRSGGVTPVQTAEAGHIVGLSSVVSNHPYDASAIVHEPSELGYVEANALRRLLDREPAVWFAVLRFLSNDVSACWDSMRKVAAFR
jgi:CRP-like cAMP-binding protein